MVTIEEQQFRAQIKSLLKELITELKTLNEGIKKLTDD